VEKRRGGATVNQQGANGQAVGGSGGSGGSDTGGSSSGELSGLEAVLKKVDQYIGGES
jgi:hypothetical protein